MSSLDQTRLLSRAYPSDVLEAIAAAIYLSALPQHTSSLDPLYASALNGQYAAPTSLPTSFPLSSWPEPVARHTLAALCLVSRDFRNAARPWLWKRLEVNVPRNWLGILDSVCGDEDVDPAAIPQNINNLLEFDSRALASPDPSRRATSPDTRAFSPERGYFVEPVSPSSPDGPSGLGSVPHDLLTPPASRDPSPIRLRMRAVSPGRWRFVKAINNTVHHSEPGLYVPTPEDPSPGRHVRHLDFNHFRTIGLRRSVGEGINARFVTDARLERLLKEMPNLQAFGATEFMDSAISTSVLAELILRGSPIPADKIRPARRGRGSQQRNAHPNGSDSESEDDVDGDEADEAERLAATKALEAIDFCGCVSTVFVSALHLFVQKEGLSASPSGRKFMELRRLGLRGVTTVPASTLTALVLSFPNLTHLDLSGTLCSPALLEGLQAAGADRESGPGMRLKSVALSRCVRLTSASIARFLIGPSYDSWDGDHASSPRQTAGVCDELTELALYGDHQYPNPLTEDDLLRIVTSAPCFTSQTSSMTYLDLSSCPVTTRVLEAAFSSAHSQGNRASSLRSLGLSHIPDLPLASLTAFLTNRAPNVEVLTLLGSCLSELSTAAYGSSGRVGEVALSLIVRSKLLDPLCSLPFRIQGLRPIVDDVEEKTPTRLRVIEFSPAVLNLLPPAPPHGSFSPHAIQSPAWTTVRSRGGRAWYVDASACWVNGEFLRGNTPRTAALVRPVQEEISRLAAIGASAAGGHGSIGWHARKMEVLHGLGMLGREDGLYGAVSFAYTTG
ncbi:hypothetical protein DL93DRAFT_2075960 [Clavulina sp. PMI_390]|nr:hypothetical protein DL93DRAFT_2075960 [Clavulina sp. PMI_390]